MNVHSLLKNYYEPLEFIERISEFRLSNITLKHDSFSFHYNLLRGVKYGRLKHESNNQILSILLDHVFRNTFCCVQKRVLPKMCLSFMTNRKQRTSNHFKKFKALKNYLLLFILQENQKQMCHQPKTILPFNTFEPSARNRNILKYHQKKKL